MLRCDKAITTGNKRHYFKNYAEPTCKCSTLSHPHEQICLMPREFRCLLCLNSSQLFVHVLSHEFWLFLHQIHLAIVFAQHMWQLHMTGPSCKSLHYAQYMQSQAVCSTVSAQPCIVIWHCIEMTAYHQNSLTT